MVMTLFPIVTSKVVTGLGTNIILTFKAMDQVPDKRRMPSLLKWTVSEKAFHNRTMHSLHTFHSH